MTAGNRAQSRSGDAFDAMGQRLSSPELLRDAIIHAINLDTIPQLQHTMFDQIEPAERERAAAFKIDLQRNRFVARRWWRRQVIARAAGIQPHDISIEHSRLGMPRIAAPVQLQHWSISTSHHNGVAVVAWSQTRTVGIDIARCDPDHATSNAARIFMTEQELVQWQQSSPDQQTALFYQFWTRKEASLKAMGTGFAIDPRGVDVRHSQVNGPRSNPLLVCDVSVEPGWACALAGGFNNTPGTTRNQSESVDKITTSDSMEIA